MPETNKPILTSIQVAARLDGFSLAPPRPGGPAGRPYASVSIPAAHEEAHAGMGRMTLD
jgi:hypothetical protein